MSFAEIAATSPVLMAEMVAVLSNDACAVVRAFRACVVRAVTCELLSAANAAVLMLTTSAAEIDGICPVVSACA